MSGCAVCVHDLYAEALEAHEHAISNIRSALHDRGVDESTWPKQLSEGFQEEDDSIRGMGNKVDLTGKDLMKAKRASLSAFEQMELQLAAKKRAQETERTGVAVDSPGKDARNAGSAVGG